MANFDIKNPPQYSDKVRKFETLDKAHADLLNSVVDVLVNNDAFLKKVVDDYENNHKNDENIHVKEEERKTWNEKAESNIATNSQSGLMSSLDKAKLDEIEDGANNYSHPTTSGNKHVPSGGASEDILGWSSDGTAKWKTPGELVPSFTQAEKRVNLKSGESFSILFGKIMKFFSDLKSGAFESKESLLLSVYPVGSIYMSTSNANPGTLFGGTWAAWGAGRVPVGINSSDTDFKTVEKTGGAKSNSFAHSHTVNSHTHTGPSHSHTVNSHAHTTGGHALTVAETPSHKHTIDRSFPWGSDWNTSQSSPAWSAGSSYQHNPWNLQSECSVVGGNASHSHGNTGNAAPGTSASGTGNTGSAAPGTDSKLGTVSNLQPYITCYMWKRTA